MLKQLFFVVLAVFFLFSATAIVLGEVSLGVEAGDWIEYVVSTTGFPAEGHDVVWARMEVLNVQGDEITVNTTTKAVNGTYSSVVMMLNPAVGAVDVWAIIPVNLSAGMSFYDRNLGNIPIQAEEQKAFGGVSRDTTIYNSDERFKRWDKATGVFLEGTDYQSEYSLTAIFLGTNMWSAQLLGFEPFVFYFLVFVLAVSVSVVSLFLFFRRRGFKLKQQ